MAQIIMRGNADTNRSVVAAMSDLPTGPRTLYASLVELYLRGDDWPGYAGLKTEFGIGPSSAQNWLKALEARGLVKASAVNPRSGLTIEVLALTDERKPRARGTSEFDLLLNTFAAAGNRIMHAESAVMHSASFVNAADSRSPEPETVWRTSPADTRRHLLEWLQKACDAWEQVADNHGEDPATGMRLMVADPELRHELKEVKRAFIDGYQHQGENIDLAGNPENLRNIGEELAKRSPRLMTPQTRTPKGSLARRRQEEQAQASRREGRS